MIDLKGKRILIVEDETSIAELLNVVLSNEGCAVSVVADGGKAKDMIESDQYDLFLFDVRVPVLGGDELYRWMRKHYPERARRVVFTTGSVIGEETKIFLDRVRRPTIFKPFTLNELRKFIRDSFEEMEQDVVSKWIRE